MEQSIASGVSVPIERMVVELGLTPRNLRSRERFSGISMAWAKPAFKAMKRHDLMPASKSWADWLQRYVDAKHAALKELAPI